MKTAKTETLPFKETSSYEKLPGHWVLAKLGKKVLRPGGIVLTHWMLSQLNITSHDEVLEMAPGIGATTREVLSKEPKSYVGVDTDTQVVENLTRLLGQSNHKFFHATARETGLPDQSVNVTLGEAYLTMQTASVKEKIVQEIHRVLKSGGRYGLHELSITTKDPKRAEQIKKDISLAIRVNANPLTTQEWEKLLQDNGFEIVAQKSRPMELLRVGRLIEDEGALGVLKIFFNALRHPSALQRVFEMRAAFEKHADDLGSISIIAKRK